MGNNADNANLFFFWKCQRVACSNFVGGFGNFDRIYPNFALRHQFRRQSTGFEEPREPQPAVNADGLAFIGQVLSFNPIKAAAKGLSGSILSFLGGRAA